MSNARVSATRFGAVRHRATDAQFSAIVMLEYVALTGAFYRGAKYEVTIPSASSEQDFIASVKEQLLIELRQKFPADNYKLKDILIFGL